jgi:branched-chain amino acid transport system permease protein
MTAALASDPTVPAPAAAWEQIDWRDVVRIGLIGGIVVVYLCLVGIVPVFDARPLISGVISLGEAALIGTLGVSGAIAARHARTGPRNLVTAGAVAGLLAGLVLSALVVVGHVVNLRAVMLNASTELYALLTFGMGLTGAWIPAVAGAILGGLAGVFWLVPLRYRSPVVRGFLSIIILGLFAGLLRTSMFAAGLGELARLLFGSEGLTITGAVLVFVLVVGGRMVRQRLGMRGRLDALPEAQRRRLQLPGLALLLGLVIVLPLLLGPFFAQVIALVALYVLMGLGLNITLGLAGLLDLGFVAFFAVGAYTVGLLTSLAEYGILDISFWAAIPFAVIIAMLFGAFLGLPILGIRGDYLAIATLGFGEIIAILARSDLLKPLLGGPRGIVNIPAPIATTPTDFLSGPVQIYYIACAFAALIAFIALRLRSSRLGRAWIAIREDEDVAEAVGINLIQTKLLAYMLGAGFAGLGGAIFAAQTASIFPSSITLFVSINVVALIIVGGMGSIPGVVLGALFLIGIPELFREFSDYRLLFYGIALIVMMRFRPEGLLPSRIVRREMHVPENAGPASVASGGPTLSGG